ncbi:TPA: baseplate J/gp47 family protein, partial [Salmonella enterica]
MADSQFARPELPQLIATIRSDLLTRFQQDVVLRRMDAEVYSRVQAAAVHTLYGYIDYLARNMLPDMCDEDWLYRHARIKRCPRKNAVSAKGFARWDGIAGTPEIPAGTQIQRDDQVTFTTLQTVKASGGLLRVPVIGDVAGTAGNTDDGTALRLGTPITGIPSTGYADTLTGGADTEEPETWRARVMERYY